MGADDAWKTLKKMAETFLKSSDEEPSFVVLYSQKTNNTRPETKLKSFGSSNMTKFMEDTEVKTKFLKACAEPIEVKEPKKLKDEPQPTHGQGVDELQGYSLRPSSSKDKCWSDGDYPGKKREISESFQESKEFPQPLLPGATKVTETITNSNMTTDMKAQSTSATGTKSKNCTEVPDTIPFGGTFQHETTSTEEVPTATTNFSMGHLSNTKTLDAKTSVVNSMYPIPRYIKRPQETSTSNGPATYPDGCMAKEMPGKPRAKSAESLHEWNNEKKLRFIQDVSEWIKGSIVRGLETDGRKIVNNNWIDHIKSSRCRKLFQAMKRPRVRYDGSSVKDLLRFIRNISCHYHELPEDVKTSIGRPRAKALDYFTSEFPFLLDHTYKVVQKFAQDVDFASYYKIK